MRDLVDELAPDQWGPDDVMADDLHRWRIACFKNLGFDRSTAERYELEGLDWHEMERYLSAGCPPKLAEFILLTGKDG